MPESIREAKIAEPASPLEYRSARDDRRDRNGAPEFDSGAIRAILFLVAIPCGLFVAVGVHVLLNGVFLAIQEASDLLFFAINFSVFLSECGLIAKILKPPEKRSSIFYLGFVTGAMLISAGLTAMLISRIV